MNSNPINILCKVEKVGTRGKEETLIFSPSYIGPIFSSPAYQPSLPNEARQ